MNQAYTKTILGLSVAGVLFAGYLSFFKLFTGNCALNEPCPFFLGYPACWYGLVLFVILMIQSIIALTINFPTCRYGIPVVSLTGTIFSGSFVYGDVMTWLTSGQSYALILPSCVYGFIVFAVIFVLSLLARKQGGAGIMN